MTTALQRRARSRRRALLAGSLIAVNAALVGLNLAKRDVLPFELGALGDDEASPSEGTGTTSPTPAVSEGPVDTGVPTATGVTAATTQEVTIDTSGADWPNGAGPVPEGPPQVRRAVFKADGRLALTGSAPNWATVTRIVKLAAEKVPGGEASIDNAMTWHPDATPDIQAGEVVIEQAALFAVNQTDIDPASVPVLDLAAQVMIDHPTVFAVVIGHTDDSGDEGINAELSNARAAAVVDYLVGKGVVGAQLVIAAAGEDDPLADNQTVAGRNANRRIEIQFKNFLIPDAALGGGP